MKIYFSVGIGDMMCIDALMTQKERESITEIYWPCRFGKCIAPIIDHNIYYRVKKHHFIDEEVGRKNMRRTFQSSPIKDTFWHFRSDIEPDYTIGKELLNIKPEDDVRPVDMVPMIMDTNRTFQGSSFLMSASVDDIDWNGLKIEPFKYILMHYPTSSRPRSDIAVINNDDWEFINNLSIKTGLKVLIISDTPVAPTLNHFIAPKDIPLTSIIALSKYAGYYVGCDSFCAILCCKVLPPHKLFIKTHDQNIYNRMPTYTWIKKYFLPHDYKAIQQFYTPNFNQREI